MNERNEFNQKEQKAEPTILYKFTCVLPRIGFFAFIAFISLLSFLSFIKSPDFLSGNFKNYSVIALYSEGIFAELRAKNFLLFYFWIAALFVAIICLDSFFKNRKRHFKTYLELDIGFNILAPFFIILMEILAIVGFRFFMKLIDKLFDSNDYESYLLGDKIIIIMLITLTTIMLLYNCFRPTTIAKPTNKHLVQKEVSGARVLSLIEALILGILAYLIYQFKNNLISESLGLVQIGIGLEISFYLMIIFAILLLTSCILHKTEEKKVENRSRQTIHGRHITLGVILLNYIWISFLCFLLYHNTLGRFDIFHAASSIQIGMTKDDVEKEIGNPSCESDNVLYYFDKKFEKQFEKYQEKKAITEDIGELTDLELKIQARRHAVLRIKLTDDTVQEILYDFDRSYSEKEDENEAFTQIQSFEIHDKDGNKIENINVLEFPDGVKPLLDPECQFYIQFDKLSFWKKTCQNFSLNKKSGAYFISFNKNIVSASVPVSVSVSTLDENGVLKLATTITQLRTDDFIGLENKIISIHIPASITKIEKDVFKYCNALEAVYITDLNQWHQIDFESEFSNPLSKASKIYLNGQELMNYK